MKSANGSGYPANELAKTLKTTVDALAVVEKLETDILSTQTNTMKTVLAVQVLQSEMLMNGLSATPDQTPTASSSYDSVSDVFRDVFGSTPKKSGGSGNEGSN